MPFGLNSVVMNHFDVCPVKVCSLDFGWEIEFVQYIFCCSVSMAMPSIRFDSCCEEFFDVCAVGI